MKLIPLSEHPSNLDPTAVLVSPAQAKFSVFRVRGGHVAACDGKAFDGLIENENEAMVLAATIGIKNLQVDH